MPGQYYQVAVNDSEDEFRLISMWTTPTTHHRPHYTVQMYYVIEESVLL